VVIALVGCAVVIGLDIGVRVGMVSEIGWLMFRTCFGVSGLILLYCVNGRMTKYR